MSETSKDARAELMAVLAKLDQVLPAEVHTTLRAPVQAADLAGLARTLAEGVQLPDDLQVLLGWHDGQVWNSPLSRKNNRRLLSVREILSERSFFADPMSDFIEPWCASWLPVLTNDAGDFVVYETVGDLRGKLLHYWHDDPSRSVAHSSLLQWAERLLHEYERPEA
ncbi:SMI1/KNR4 family protein [Cupriavidus necator]|uniref:SMI1/KNR4 family protein n=1 Tax=Cupriavidus necator TaxID=106590 RepID=UPI0011D19D51|nr:SMI1/KNR4 family protein [Cupriavidus necator]MDX6007968.1 SMI1/KNR4 family protein [Cupriavidus necator]